MTVRVTRDDGGVDDYARFADSYIKHRDGSLEIVRAGTASTVNYEAGYWSGVAGDEKRARGGRAARMLTRLFGDS